MKIIDYFTEATTFLKTNVKDKKEVFHTLATALGNSKIITNKTQLIKAF